MATATTTYTRETSRTRLEKKTPGLGCGPYGERLCVQVADELARETPTRIYATITNSPDDIDQGFTDITIKQFANAVNYAAWEIHSLFGPCEKGAFRVIAYIGLPDLRYAVYLYAAIKTGYQLMIPSVRNSFSQQLAVFEEAECDIVLHTSGIASIVDQMKSANTALRSYAVPDLNVMLNGDTTHYRYDKTWAEARDDPVVLAHSSGSTGTPKPTTVTNGVYSCYDNHRRIPNIPGRRNQAYSLLALEGGRFYNPFPPFHLAGLFAMTIMPIFYDCIITLGPPEKPPSGELLSRAMRMLKIRAGWCPPTVIEQLLEQPGGFEQAASLDWVMYTGGPLAKAVGDKLSTVTNVCQLYGSTETGVQVALVPHPENWQWFEWHPLLENTMEDQGDGTYEMVVHKDPKLDWVRHLSHTYPHLDVWRTNDLFVRHPTKPELWKFHGRKDDVLVLSNGEKFNPVNMEGAIVGHPLVRGALIVGTGRFQAALIVEPIPGMSMSKDEFIDMIWPSVEHANTLGPQHGRIFKHKVVVASDAKPFARAGKGTVIRGQTTKLYAEEVETMYAGSSGSFEQQLSSVEDLDAIIGVVRSCISCVSPDTIEDTQDIFMSGIDSLQTLELTKILNNAFVNQIDELEQGKIRATLLYTNPTIRKLATHLQRAFLGLEPLIPLEDADRASEMNLLINKHSRGLTPDPSKISVSRAGQLTVAITGTTGSLGTHLLRKLLHDPQVSRIYCMNRAQDAQERHMRNLRDDEISIVKNRCHFYTTDFGAARFGLSEEDYSHLSDTVDVVIHNAWKVNFNHDLSSFEDPHVSGLRRLIDFSLSSTNRTHICFVSSLSSVSNWTTIHGADCEVPEIAIDNSDVALHMGYGESKHVAERILQNAIEQAGIDATVFRVGQLAGPLSANEGVWNQTEWFPSLMKTSKSLRILPDALPTIDWIPVDRMASILAELVHNDRSNQSSEIYNLANPTSSEWISLIPAIFEAWGTDIQIVPFEHWIDAVSQQSDMEAYPALKILDFYRGFAQEARVPKSNRIKYELRKAVQHSRTMAELQCVDRSALATWIKQWESPSLNLPNQETMSPSTSTITQTPVQPKVENDEMDEGTKIVIEGIPTPPTFTDKSEERIYLKGRLALAFRIFAKYGFDEGVAGHITLRDPILTDHFWVNPLGRSFAQMRSSDLILVNSTGSVVDGGANRKLNRAAYMIHHAIHVARPEVNCAAHSHSLYGRAFCTLGRPIDTLTQDACAFYKDLSVYRQFKGVVVEEEEGRNIAEALGPSKACLLQNHGLLTVGKTIEEAVFWFSSLDKCCHAQLLAEAAGHGSGRGGPIPIEDEDAAFTSQSVGNSTVGWFSAQPAFDIMIEEVGSSYLQ